SQTVRPISAMPDPAETCHYRGDKDERTAEQRRAPEVLDLVDPAAQPPRRAPQREHERKCCFVLGELLAIAMQPEAARERRDTEHDGAQVRRVEQEAIRMERRERTD